jgi:hypothetical protein
MPLSRRSLLSTAPGALLLPRLARADTPANRRFLFVLAEGGWDQTFLFAPLFGEPLIDMEGDAEPDIAEDIPFVAHASRPSVSAFLARYGAQTCFINGFEARSVAHDVCLRLVLTGTSLPAADDWPARIAAATGSQLLLPVIHLGGPGYTHSHGAMVVRVGDAGQLPELVTGEAFTRSDRLLTAPSSRVESLEADLLARRIAAGSAAATPGGAAQLWSRAGAAVTRLGPLAAAADEINLGVARTVKEGMSLLVDAFAADLSRCGFVRYRGWQNLGWDTHADLPQQGRSFEDLFDAVLATMERLRALPGHSAPTLADETTIVLLSEMGRYPQINPRGGKEHWTYTSCALIGAGVRGGRAIGGYDSACAGQRVDLASGDATPQGTALTPNHIGATLLALAGVDPAEALPDAEPIHAALA